MGYYFKLNDSMVELDLSGFSDYYKNSNTNAPYYGTLNPTNIYTYYFINNNQPIYAIKKAPIWITSVHFSGYQNASVINPTLDTITLNKDVPIGTSVYIKIKQRAGFGPPIDKVVYEKTFSITTVSGATRTISAEVYDFAYEMLQYSTKNYYIYSFEITITQPNGDYAYCILGSSSNYTEGLTFHRYLHGSGSTAYYSTDVYLYRATANTNTSVIENTNALPNPLTDVTFSTWPASGFTYTLANNTLSKP